MMERKKEAYTALDRIVFVFLMLVIIFLLIIGAAQEPPNVIIDDENLNFEVDLTESVEPRNIENFLDYTCAELENQFGKVDTPYERDILITNIMNLKDCNVKISCISDEKFEFYLEQFNSGVVSQEEFKEVNEEYSTCAQ